MTRHGSAPLAPFACPAPGRHAAGVLALSAWLAAAAIPAAAQTLDTTFPWTNGNVYAMALAGNTLYIGGQFTSVSGTPTGGGAAMDRLSGQLDPGWADVAGSVLACVDDGAGGWYLGGTFSSIAGLTRAGLAHLRADGSLDGWNPGANGFVTALTRLGSTVYAGGAFTTAGGQARVRLAAFDAVIGAVRPWNPGADNTVQSLAACEGAVFAGGSFATAGGQPRARLAAFDAESGATLPWNLGANDIVLTLVAQDAIVYAGGYFSTAGGEPRSRLAAFSATTGELLPWDPGASNVVQALAINGRTLFVGGNFPSLGGQPRSYLGAVDAISGELLPWNPAVATNVRALAVYGSTVYVGGTFVSVSGQSRLRLAAIHAVTAEVLPWNPGAEADVRVLGASGTHVYAGGDFKAIGAAARNRLAAIDLTTRSLLPLHADPGNLVFALAADEATVFVGGMFITMNDIWTGPLVAFDAASGALVPRCPAADGTVTALFLHGETVYGVGEFGYVGGATHHGLVSFDRTSGWTWPWAPSFVGSGPLALAIRESTLYVGGFGIVPTTGAPMERTLGAHDLASGVPLPWAAVTNGHVAALAVRDSTIYAGGSFSLANGEIRGSLAAFDATTGALRPLTANLSSGGASALAVWNDRLCIGGFFTAVGTTARNNLALLNLSTGNLTSWNPSPSSGVVALLPSGPWLYSAGEFGTIAGQLRPGLARFYDPALMPALSAAIVGPVGGDTLIVGETSLLRWTAGGGVPRLRSVDLLLSRGGPTGPWELIAAGVTGRTEHAWKVSGLPGSQNAYLRVVSRDFSGNTRTVTSSQPFLIVGTGVAAVGDGASTSFTLDPVSPNPASGPTRLTYTLPRRVAVRLAVVDVQGREVARLEDGEREAGRHSVSLDSRSLAPGLYFVRLQASGVDVRRRLAIVR